MKILLLLLPLLIAPLFAQEVNDEINPLSLNPIPKSRQLFKRTLWWRVDLREKQNLSFFARGFELSHVIIEAVKNDALTPYLNDSVHRVMTKEEFIENLTIPQEGGGLTEEEKALGFSDDFGGDSWGVEGDVTADVEESNEFAAQDISIIEIKEDWVFDKIRSRMYYDAHAITLVLPAEKNPALFEKPIASFRFVDLVALFRSIPEKAIWYNPINSALHLNMADAFLLRHFDGNLAKIANPEDNRIIDIYSESREQAIIAALQLEEELIEFESQLWEY